jgi:2-hydroxy-3-oxopropionate reductase
MDLGFIGLGAMGRPMVERLLAAGHRVAIWARRSEAMAPLIGRGAMACNSPGEVARQSEITFSIVTRDADVEAVIHGPGGLGEGFRPGGLHIDMSTVARVTVRSLALQLAEKSVALLDAPVSGGPVGAAAGTLAIMVGGRAGDLERARPVLGVLGQRIVHVGEQGAGQVAKACNQMIMVATIEAVAEAFALAAASGLDLSKVKAAIGGGSAASRVLDVFGQRMVDANYVNGVESRLHHKDFGLVLAQAQALNVPLPLAAQVAQRLNQLIAQGGARDDTASLYRLFALPPGDRS